MDPAINELQPILNLHWIDITIVVGYLLVLILVGIYHSGKQDSLMDFFLAHKGMTWVPVGISLMAALNSGMDYLNTPSVVIRFGWIFILSNISWVFIYPYMFYVILPMFRRINVMSAYEYLGLRFGEGVRTMAAVIFMLWRLSWMATAIYVPCLAITTAIGRPGLLIPMIIAIGVIVTFYTMMGGIKAVIWNDIAQFFLMMSGLVVTLVIVMGQVEGGFTTILSNFFQEGIDNLPDPSVDTSTMLGKIWSYFTIDMVIPAIVLTWFVRMVGFTSDQVMIQRFSTAKTIGHARQSFVITAVADVVWMVLLFFVGLALATYLKVGNEFPAWVTENPDRIFPYFMADVFPIGVTGFVLAAIMAASLSSIDSAINSLTSVGMVDFYNRFIMGRTRDSAPETIEEQHHQVRVSRVLTIVFGALGVALACYIRNMGTLFQIVASLLGMFMGPMLSIYWLGMFTRRANTVSTILGGVVGTLVAAYLAFFTNLSPMWVAPAGMILTFVIGCLFGSSSYTESGRRWNFYAIIKTELVE